MIQQLRYRYENSKFANKKGSTKFVYIVGFALVLWFLFGMIFNSENEETKPTPEAVRVDVQKLNKRNVMSDVLIYGQTKSSEKVALKVRTSGIVEKKHVKKGQFVKKGTPILTIKMEDRIAKLNAAKSAEEKAKIEFNTAKTLLKQGLISKVEYVANEASYRNAKATLDNAYLDIDYTTVRAPFDGVLNEFGVEEGSYVGKESEVGVFLNLDPIKIVAEVPEKYITRLTKGVVANAHLSSGDKIDALLTYVGAVANTSTRTFSVELQAKNKDRKIVEGLTAEIRLPLNTVPAIKLSVSSCLTFGEDGSVGVKTIDDTNTVHFYPVEIVKEEKDGLWVFGLPEQVNVIVAGGEFVNVGEKVLPTFVGENGEKIETATTDTTESTQTQTATTNATQPKTETISTTENK